MYASYNIYARSLSERSNQSYRTYMQVFSTPVSGRGQSVDVRSGGGGPGGTPDVRVVVEEEEDQPDPPVRPQREQQ